MTSLPVFLLTVLLTIITLSHGQSGQGIRLLPPIPLLDQDPGIPYFSNSSAGVKLEVFLDLNCPDSAVAWGVLKQVAGHYGPDRLNLVIHPFMLPYYRHSFLCSQVTHCMLD